MVKYPAEKITKGGSSKMAQQVRVLIADPGNLEGRQARTDSIELFSDLHMHTVHCV